MSRRSSVTLETWATTPAPHCGEEVGGMWSIRDNDPVTVASDNAEPDNTAPDNTGTFRDASFSGADFTGARFRDCDLRRVKIADSMLIDIYVSGYMRNLVVNNVDVTAFVNAALDRRHPERAQLRTMKAADDNRAGSDTIERTGSETVTR